MMSSKFVERPLHVPGMRFPTTIPHSNAGIPKLFCVNCSSFLELRKEVCPFTFVVDFDLEEEGQEEIFIRGRHIDLDTS
jgi:hypothetical protein